MRSNGGLGGQLLTFTDKEGRFRFSSVSKSVRRYFIQVAPGLDGGLLPRVVRVDNPEGLKPVKVEVALARGMLVRGRVRDRRTGQPVPGARITAFALPDNKYFGARKGYESVGRLTAKGGNDGRFQMVTIPGRIVLAVRADTSVNGTTASPYLMAVPSKQDRDKLRISRGMITTAGGGLAPMYLFNAVKVVSVEKEGESFDVLVDLGRSATIDVQDPQGKPVTRVLVAGTAAISSNTALISGSRVTVVGLDPKSPRQVFFYHPQKKLAAGMMLRGDEDKPLTVRLQPTGVVTGRVVDQRGRPVAGVQAVLKWQAANARNLHRELRPYLRSAVTDEDGRFRADGVLLNVAFGLSFARRRTQIPLDANRTWKGPTADKLQLDLGDIKVKSQQ